MPDLGESLPEPLVPAATVALLRETPSGLEVLLLHKNANLTSFADSWVFPGGRIDPEDYAGGTTEADAARSAAVREAREEAGLEIEAAALTPLSRWTTPTGWGRRFRSWFFVASAPSGPVRIDNGEIDGHRWISPQRALDAQRINEIVLPPATYVTLVGLARHDRLATILASLEGDTLREYLPRTLTVPGGRCSLYQADVAYDSQDLAAQGPRQRLWMLDEGWRYETAP